MLEWEKAYIGRLDDHIKIKLKEKIVNLRAGAFVII